MTTDPAELAALDSAAAQRRSGALMSAVTLVSRLGGFVRIVVVSAVLGSTFLGDTYQTANSLPNLVFELVAAGTLSAVLIPTLVARLHEERREDAERLAGAVLGFALGAMAVVVLAGVVLADPLARLLFVADPDAADRAAKVTQGAFFLRCFLPQVFFYVVAMVCTGVLNAQRRFLAGAAAPIWNNVCVIAVYFAYGRWFGETARGTVTTSGGLLLGVGTTVGVVLLALPQVLAVRRSCFRLRPTLDRHNPDLRRVARLGLYAAGYVGLNQVGLMVMVVLSNRTNVVPFQVGWAFFLLPFALFATPLATAAFPALARLQREGDRAGFAAEAARLLGNVAFCVLPVGVAMVALAEPASGVFRIGNMTAAGTRELAVHLRSFGLAVLGYCWFLALTRVAYARHDTRLPTVANAAGLTLGTGLMLGLVFATRGLWQVAALGLGTALAYLVAAGVVAARGLDAATLGSAAAATLRCLPGAGLMAVVAWGLAGRVTAAAGDGRWALAAACVAGGAAGLAVYLAAAKVLRAPQWGLLSGRLT